MQTASHATIGKQEKQDEENHKHQHDCRDKQGKDNANDRDTIFTDTQNHIRKAGGQGMKPGRGKTNPC
jgi:hypothetical protein